jgi:hypothetical protein
MPTLMSVEQRIALNPSIQVVPIEKCLKYFYWINVNNEEEYQINGKTKNPTDPKQLSYVTTINGKQYSYDKRWDTTEEISDEDDSLENCRRAIPSPHRTMTDVQDELNRQLKANN